MDITDYGDVTVVKLTGSLDAALSDELTADLIEIVEQGRVYLVLDVGGVGYISSAALRAILAACQTARRYEGDLRIAKAEGNTHKVMEIAGFTRIMQFYERLPTAIRSYA